jgi:hypothetical protein
MNEFGVENTKCKVGVLNLASDEVVAGGWLQSLCATQVFGFFVLSTLLSTDDCI